MGPGNPRRPRLVFDPFARICGRAHQPRSVALVRDVIGGNKAPIVDTWWQTETGAIMISPAARYHRPPSPDPRWHRCPVSPPRSSTTDAKPLGPGGNGYLVLDEPWPAMLRGIWGDMDRYRDTYWSRYAEEGWYFAGDGAKYDDDGALWVLGRVDDVMNVLRSPHLHLRSGISTGEPSRSRRSRRRRCRRRDHRTGHSSRSSSSVKASENTGDVLIAELKAQVSTDISPIAKPRQITIVPELPKTRSGKIMRRLLRDVAEGRDLGDTSTLVDPKVFDRNPRQVGPSAPCAFLVVPTTGKAHRAEPLSQLHFLFRRQPGLLGYANVCGNPLVQGLSARGEKHAYLPAIVLTDLAIDQRKRDQLVRNSRQRRSRCFPSDRAAQPSSAPSVDARASSVIQ